MDVERRLSTKMAIFSGVTMMKCMVLYVKVTIVFYFLLYIEAIYYWSDVGILMLFDELRCPSFYCHAIVEEIATVMSV